MNAPHYTVEFYVGGQVFTSKPLWDIEAVARFRATLASQKLPSLIFKNTSHQVYEEDEKILYATNQH